MEQPFSEDMKLFAIKPQGFKNVIATTFPPRLDFDVNLLEQVLDTLIAHGRNANDILFITEGKGEYMLYDDFNRKSDFTYSFLDGAVGDSTVLNPDLQLVGKDFYIDFEQGEFTLAMCWHEIPKMPDERNRNIPLTVDFSYE